MKPSRHSLGLAGYDKDVLHHRCPGGDFSRWVVAEPCDPALSAALWTAEALPPAV